MGVLSTTRDALILIANVLLVAIALVALFGTEGSKLVQWTRSDFDAALSLLGGAAVFFYMCAFALVLWERKIRRARDGTDGRRAGPKGSP